MSFESYGKLATLREPNGKTVNPLAMATEQQSDAVLGKIVSHRREFEGWDPQVAQMIFQDPKGSIAVWQEALKNHQKGDAEIFTLSSLLEKPYIAYFSDNVLKFSGGKVDLGKRCNMSAPKALGKITSEREILQRLPGCAGLPDKKLLTKAKTLVPDFHTVLGQLMRYITSAEENKANGVTAMNGMPIDDGTWFVTICLVDGELRTLYGDRYSDGWSVYCCPVELDRQWHAEFLLLLATEASAL